MNNIKSKLFIGVFVLALIIPSSASAYFTTAQSATKLNERTILYTVTYQFGFAGRELYMPIVSERDLVASSTVFKLGYEIQDNDKKTSVGKSRSIVLSNDEDVQIKDGQYYLPLTKSAEFTLVTLLTISDEELAADLDLSLLVTNLPFQMVKAGSPIPAHLNPSELQYYHTPAISLGK